MFKRTEDTIKENPSSISPTSNADIRYLEYVLKNWLTSKERDEQLLAEKYYDGHHEVLERKKKVIGADGQLVEITNVANNKLVDNIYRKLVDQKTNYALGKPLTISTEKDEYLQQLYKIFNKFVHRQIRTLAQYAVDGGIAWLYPYYDEDSKLSLAVFPSYEICPIWRDKAHTKLDGAMRYYQNEEFTDNGGVKKVEYVDLYTIYGITHFTYRQGKLTPTLDVHSDYMSVGDEPFNWNRLPIIPFKYNSKEIPLIRNVKSLQDQLNECLSNFADNMQEDPRTSILVLKNYDGTNIPEFRQNLATYGVIKVTTVDGVQGGVETLKVDVNAANYQAELMQLKRAIVENGRGFDAKEERMDGDPNQMNIESMYTDIDLDINDMETEFQAGFEELKWFIDQYLIHTGKGDFTEEEVDFIFNRDFFINENAKIDNCVKSVGVLSQKTILSRHPWVTNVAHEMREIEADKKAELEEMDATMKIQAQNSPEPKTSGGDE